MNKLMLMSVLTFFASTANAQVGISISQKMTVEPNTIYQVDSDNKGVLFPRMTTSQKLAISSNASDLPPNGLIVYDVDLKCLQYWSSGLSNETSQWKGHCAKRDATTTPAPDNPLKP